MQGIIDTQAAAVQQAHARVSEMEATMEARQLTKDAAKARPVSPRQAPVSRGRPTNISVQPHVEVDMPVSRGRPTNMSVQPCVEVDISQGTSPPVVMEARWAIQDTTKGKSVKPRQVPVSLQGKHGDIAVQPHVEDFADTDVDPMEVDAH
ncbi:hypothetical protein EDC04DRAFT_2893879 [Pisolithus marmoratus]|nr:hypothetical protein EDC04DRAFT_2893879 [Pisolithus marmoratus]